jgi:Tol biopolymer transport system component
VTLAGRQLAAVFAATGITAAAGPSPPASDGRTPARPAPGRVVLTSDRDGNTRGYTIRADGKRLTPLLLQSRRLIPVTESADGRTIAYVDSAGGVYTSRADGTGVRRIVPEGGDVPILSRDGKLLAYEIRQQLWIVRTDGRSVPRLMPGRIDGLPEWSPDASAIAYLGAVGERDDVLVVQPLRGSERVIARGALGGFKLAWSPDGSWIAYLDHGDDSGVGSGLRIIRPDGRDSHRVAPEVEPFEWSPDGRRLAYVDGTALSIIGVDGRAATKLRLKVGAFYLRWSQDGRRLAFSGGDDGQIWIVGANGGGLRRLTSRGVNVLMGWTTVVPALAPARPLPLTDRVASAHSIVSSAQIRQVAADGPRIAFIGDATPIDCDHVAIWTPSTRSIRRVSALPAPCNDVDVQDTTAVALASTRAAWVSTSCCGEAQNTTVFSATTSRPEPKPVVYASSDRSTGAGTYVGGLRGDRGLIAYTIETRCDPTEDCPGRRSIVSTTVRALGRRSAIATAKGPLDLLTVDAGRIVVATAREVRLISARGRVLRRFAIRADAAALSGTRLAVEGPTGITVYDIVSRRRVEHFAPREALAGLEAGILMTESTGGVTLRRLADGRRIALRVPDEGRAQFEPPGLYVATGHRITFTPMRKLLRRLGG